ncbi:hypothetical protein AB0N81_41460, partial [Streptomyces sp. NPDC093510]
MSDQLLTGSPDLSDSPGLTGSPDLTGSPALSGSPDLDEAASLEEAMADVTALVAGEADAWDRAGLLPIGLLRELGAAGRLCAQGPAAVRGRDLG